MLVTGTGITGTVTVKTVTSQTAIVLDKAVSLADNAVLSFITNIKLHKSKSIIGKNTEQAVLSGFFWGYNGLINGIISRIKKKTNQKYKIIFTGGLAHLFNKDIKDKVTIDKNLTINGLIKVSKHFNL